MVGSCGAKVGWRRGGGICGRGFLVTGDGGTVLRLPLLPLLPWKPLVRRTWAGEHASGRRDASTGLRGALKKPDFISSW